jgi:hypothetical protein
MRSGVIQASFMGLRPGFAPGARTASHVQTAIQRKEGGPASAIPAVRTGNAFQVPATFRVARTGPGERLPPVLQRKMEELFRADFSDVRIHVGPQAAAIGAVAFTMASDVFFAPGQYEPHSPRGQRLLGHELTHVVQQRAGLVRNPFGSGIAVVQDPRLEAEAERMGLRVPMIGMMGGGSAQPKSLGPPISTRTVQRASVGKGVLGFEDLKIPTGYGAVTLTASLNGTDLGHAWSKKTTYSKGTEHAEDALVDFIEELEFLSPQVFTAGKTLVINGLTASPCSKARGTCDKPDMTGCTERLIELAGRGFKIMVNADHYYQPSGVVDAKNKSKQACEDMKKAGITVNVAKA